MSVHYEGHGITVHHGDCLDVLATLPDNSVDAVVTDPPYGLEFMGKEWDRPWAVGMSKPGYSDAERMERPAFGDSRNANCRTCGGRQRGAKRCACGTPAWDRHPREDMLAFQQWCQTWATECLRVLKPGGHLLAFGGTRTSHRLTCAIEDAGFEIRDSIAWLYGSGFPKSLDVSKAIDKAAGVEREVTGHAPSRLPQAQATGWGNAGVDAFRDARRGTVDMDVTAPATDEARRWQGWGTALKPAHEPITVARKPLAGTVAANVVAHGTGALNVDGCRVEHKDPPGTPQAGMSGRTGRGFGPGGTPTYRERATDQASAAGRWPANVVLDEDQAAELDRQSGDVGGQSGGAFSGSDIYAQDAWTKANMRGEPSSYGDTGGASRFFYTAKAGSAERVRMDGVAHPTVKSLSLMRWLVRLVTSPGGVCLDPFAGSGTTTEACILEGFRCIAIEREAEYLPLITQRINRRRDPEAAVRAARVAGEPEDLFGDAP